MILYYIFGTLTILWAVYVFADGYNLMCASVFGIEYADYKSSKAAFDSYCDSYFADGNCGTCDMMKVCTKERTRAHTPSLRRNFKTHRSLQHESTDLLPSWHALVPSTLPAVCCRLATRRFASLMDSYLCSLLASSPSSPSRRLRSSPRW